MTNQFPYEMIKKQSRVLLYGAGVIGQEFFWQLRNSPYCTLIGMTDKAFSREVEPPFYPIEAIPDLSFDYVVIASTSALTIAEIRLSLLSCGISAEKIVSKSDYGFIYADAIKDARTFQVQYEAYRRVIDAYERSDSDFAGASLYQSLPGLSLHGRRDTAERVESYCLRDYIGNSDSVLDIGCNCGFLDMEIASFAGKVCGVDVDREMIATANAVRDTLTIKNVAFRCIDIFTEDWEETFDCVFACAIHGVLIDRCGIDEAEFAERVLRHLKKGGRLFFESHAYRSGETELHFFALDAIFQKYGLHRIFYKYHYGKCAGNLNRDIIVYRAE